MWRSKLDLWWGSSRLRSKSKSPCTNTDIKWQQGFQGYHGGIKTFVTKDTQHSELRKWIFFKKPKYHCEGSYGTSGEVPVVVGLDLRAGVVLARSLANNSHHPPACMISWHVDSIVLEADIPKSNFSKYVFLCHKTTGSLGNVRSSLWYWLKSCWTGENGGTSSTLPEVSLCYWRSPFDQTSICISESPGHWLLLFHSLLKPECYISPTECIVWGWYMKARRIKQQTWHQERHSSNTKLNNTKLLNRGNQL